MRRIEARRKNAKAFRLRHSQSLARRRQRLSHAMVRSTIQRFGKTTNSLTPSERLTISMSRCGRTFATAFANFGPFFAEGMQHWEPLSARKLGQELRVGDRGNELFTRNRLIEPLVLSARLAKDRIKRGFIKLRRHKMPPRSFNSSCSSLPHRGVTRRDTRQS